MNLMLQAEVTKGCGVVVAFPTLTLAFPDCFAIEPLVH